MLLKDLNKTAKPFSFSHETYDTPHLSLETNMTCNLNCKACYNLSKDFVKTFNQIKDEIEIALKKRNLETITILGGEPTLHPNLPDIIRYIESRNVFAQLLTNGIIFLEDDEDELLKKCLKAGVRRIIVHIDEGQEHYHGNIKKAIRKIFDKLESYKIPFALSVTVYNVNKLNISDLIESHMHYRYYDGVIGILERDFNDTIQKKSIDDDKPKLEDVYNAIYKKLNIEPCAYLPSSAQEDFISWLVYLFLVNKKTGKTYDISPALFSLSRKLVKIRTGRNPSGGFYSRRTLRLSILFLFALQTLLKPRTFHDLRKIIIGSAGLRNIRLLFITLQNPPEYNSEKGLIQFCYHCPDATIRNGKLIPVCVADFINPHEKELELAKEFPEYKDEVSRIIYKHLDED